jgi:hypothetical protein
VRRLPVLNRDKRLVGVVALAEPAGCPGVSTDSCNALTLWRALAESFAVSLLKRTYLSVSTPAWQA